MHVLVAGHQMNISHILQNMLQQGQFIIFLYIHSEVLLVQRSH